MPRLQCDMDAACTELVTHIGERGFVYCSACALRRHGWERVRQLRVWEVDLLENGQPIPSFEYYPNPET